MGGHVRGTHQALLMSTVVDMHAAAHRAYDGPRGGGNRPTHFVTLMLPRLVRVLARAHFKTRLLKLESGMLVALGRRHGELPTQGLARGWAKLT